MKLDRHIHLSGSCGSGKHTSALCDRFEGAFTVGIAPYRAILGTDPEKVPRDEALATATCDKCLDMASIIASRRADKATKEADRAKKALDSLRERLGL